MQNLGNITTSSKDIVNEIASIVTSTFGVIGVSNSDFFNEGFSYLVSKRNYEKGIVLKEEDSELNIELYVVIAFDFKVDLVLKSIEKNINWVLKNKYDVEISNLDIFVTNIGKKK